MQFYKGDFINRNPIEDLRNDSSYFNYVDKNSSTIKYIEVISYSLYFFNWIYRILCILFEDQGLETELFESGELLLKGVDDHVKEGWELFHPIDDTNLISGYAP